MFSQIRNAVENLAVQPVRRSLSQDSDTSGAMSRTNSGEGGVQSPTHLADSAILSIRKSLQSQRPSSPARTGPNGMANGGVHDPNRPRSRLEERLRASLTFGIGEASNPSTEASTIATNTPISTQVPIPLPDATPPSPTQAPLPDSPIGSSAIENGMVSLASLLDLEEPLGASPTALSTSSSSNPLAPQTPGSGSRPVAPVPATHTTNGVPSTQPTSAHFRSKSTDSSLSEKLERVVELEDEDEEFQGRRYAEAQMPLPPSPPPVSAELPSIDPPEHQPAVDGDARKGDVSLPPTTDPSQADPDTEANSTSITTSLTNNTDGDATGTDVEALRQQLKRFKERFTGKGKT